MKHSLILSFCFIIVLSCAPNNIWGQFAVPVQQESKTIQTLEFESNQHEQQQTQFAGNTLMTIGQTLTSIGIMSMISNGPLTPFIMIGGKISRQQKTRMETILLTDFGALLTGIPIWIIGTRLEKHPDGRQYLGDPKGFGLRVDLAANVSPVLGVDCIAGYHFGPYVFAGGGVGFRTIDGLAIPVFTDLRVTCSPKRVAPFFGLKAGLSYYDEQTAQKNPYFDAFFSLSLGTRIRHRHNDCSRGDWWFASVTEYSPICGLNSGLQISYSF